MLLNSLFTPCPDADDMGKTYKEEAGYFIQTCDSGVGEIMHKTGNKSLSISLFTAIQCAETIISGQGSLSEKLPQNRRVRLSEKKFLLHLHC